MIDKEFLKRRAKIFQSPTVNLDLVPTGIDLFISKIEELEQQIVNEKKDAERYRYLRDTDTWSDIIWEAIDMDMKGNYQQALNDAVDFGILENSNN